MNAVALIGFLLCTAPEYHQFDFWIGDWDVTDFDRPNKIVARVRVSGILDGCALQEDYKDTAGLEGRSINIYDVSRKVWQQTWVTNRGQLLTIEGTLKSGEMVLTGGREKRVRGVWKPVAGGVSEVAVTSVDGGKTWQPWFDLMFRPHKK